MFTLKKYPFFWIVICFIIGILLAAKTSDWLISSHSLFFLVLSIFIFIILPAKKNTLILFSYIWMLLGYINYFQLLSFSELQRKHVEVVAESNVVKGLIVELDSTRFYWKTLVESKLAGSGIYYLCYLKRGKSESQKPAPGDSLYCKGMLKPFNNPFNPKEFDYRKFMNNKGIYFHLFSTYQNWNIKKNASTHPIVGLKMKIGSLRSRMREVIRNSLKNETNSALITALFLGEKSELTSDLLNAYSSAGARHVLTVSGMHVGIVILIMNMFFSLTGKRNKFIRLIRDLLTIIIIWFYVLLTGAGPASVRAGFMFSLLLVGRLFNGQTLSINSLAFSAFVLLVMNPRLLFNLSFIMSYAAMLSIILFYPVLNKYWRPANILFRYLWQLACISLSAQFFIIPVSAYYFHQFSLLFIVSGIISSPFAVLIFFFSFLFFLDAFSFGLIAIPLTIILNSISSAFNNFVLYMDALPFGAVQHVQLSTPLLIILLLLAIQIYYLLKTNSVKALMILIAGMNIALLLFNYQLHINQKQNSICIYSDAKTTIIDIFYKGNCYSWNDIDPQLIESQYCNKNYRISRRPVKIVPLIKNDETEKQTGLLITELNGVKIGIVSGNKCFTTECIKLDLLVVCTDEPAVILEVIDNIDFNTLVIPVVYASIRKRLNKQLVDSNLIFDIKSEGALVINI